MDVKPENRDKAQAPAAEGSKVAADEPGTLSYEWHYSEENESLVLLGSYSDSASLTPPGPRRRAGQGLLRETTHEVPIERR